MTPAWRPTTWPTRNRFGGSPTPVGGGRIKLPADTDRAWTVHAGTKATDGRLVASGGRVLGIVGLGEDLEQARGRAYQHLSRVGFPDGFHRTDIGIPY